MRSFTSLTYNRGGSDVRTIIGILREQRGDGFMLHARPVGSELSGMRLTAIPFTDDDLDLALNQLGNLQEIQDMGMISLDSTLSWPADGTPLID